MAGPRKIPAWVLNPPKGYTSGEGFCSRIPNSELATFFAIADAEKKALKKICGLHVGPMGSVELKGLRWYFAPCGQKGEIKAYVLAKIKSHVCAVSNLAEAAEQLHHLTLTKNIVKLKVDNTPFYGVLFMPGLSDETLKYSLELLQNAARNELIKNHPANGSLIVEKFQIMLLLITKYPDKIETFENYRESVFVEAFTVKMGEPNFSSFYPCVYKLSEETELVRFDPETNEPIVLTDSYDGSLAFFVSPVTGSGDMTELEKVALIRVLARRLMKKLGISRYYGPKE